MIPGSLAMMASGSLVPTSSLVAYYALENLNDSFGGYTLTNPNSASFVAGKVSNGVNCVRASSHYLDAGDAHDITGAISFVAWIKLSSINANGWIVGKDSDTLGRAYAWGVGNDNLMRVQISGVGSSVSASTAFTTGTWYFVAATFDDATNAIKYYLNGAADGTATNTGVLAATTAPFNIGRRSYVGAEEYFDGVIDEVGVWSRVLTADEILTMYNGGSGTTL